MLYRATFVLQCDCGAKPKRKTKEFKARSDIIAAAIIKTVLDKKNPPKGQHGVRWTMQSFWRIDSPELRKTLNEDGTEWVFKEEDIPF